MMGTGAGGRVDGELVFLMGTEFHFGKRDWFWGADSGDGCTTM